MTTAAQLKKELTESGHDETSVANEYCKLFSNAVDSFVALGGNADTTGVVRKDVLVETIKR